MSDLLVRVGELQAEFLRFADRYPWICFGQMTRQGDYAQPVAGEADGPMPYLVRVPDDGPVRAIIVSVDDLTWRAESLLRDVMARSATFPADWAMEIRRVELGWGWPRWLAYTVAHAGPVLNGSRIDNYPQIAADGLRALKEYCRPSALGESPATELEPLQFVTLDQMAALVNRSKKTLERMANSPDSGMPPPNVEGGGGKPHEWKWEAVRPWLEKTFNRQLPERFPA